MKEIIEKLDNGLQVSCQIPKGLAVAFYISLIKEALASGKFVICVLSEIEPKTLIEKLRERGIDEKNLKQIRCIDWYSWQTETVISVESIEQGFRCARDTINLQIALNKVLKSKKEREKIAIIEMVDRCWELFGELETIETLIKFQNKLRKQGILSFYTITKTKSTEILSRFSAAVKISERSGKVKCELQKQEEKIEIRYRLKDGVFEPYSEENGLERSVEIEVCPECGAYLQPDEEKCAVCGAVITPMKEEDGEKERHKFHFVLCTNCGAFVNEDAVRCSVCGAELLAGEEEEGAVTEIQSKDEKEGIFICSNCGAFVSAKAKKCEICGASLEAEETEEALVQVNIPAEPGIDEKSVYVCMQCGAFVDAERKNCPICGAEIAISEKVPQKALERVLETSLTLPSICPRCGAFVRAGENCSICGDIGKQMVHAKVNGLINGVREKKIVGKEGLINGFVNGRVNGKIPAKVSVKRGRRKEKQKLWRKVAGFLAVFIVVAAGLLSILLFVQYPGITVDGKFEDWEGTTIYENPVYSLQNPSVEIGKYGVHLYRNYLSFYVEVRDAAMLGKAFNETDAFFMFVDADESASTGYAISGIGADYMAVFSGWDCAVKSASAYQWNSSRNQTDFNGFESKYSGKGAVDGQRFEGQFTLTQPASIPRIVFYAQDNYGNRSRGQAVVSTHPGAIVITQSNPQHGIVNHSQNVELLHLSVETKAKENWIRQINVSIAGNASATDFDGIELRAGNNVVAGNYTDGMFRFNVSMPLEKNSEMEIGIYARLNSSAIGKSVGLRIPSRSDVFVENGTATLYSSFIGNTYVETVPQEIVIDGAFADWQNVMLNTDTENDTFPPGRFVWPSVDIAKYGMVDMENVSFYLSTYGVVLAGEELPMIVERPSEVVTPPPPEVPVLEGMDALFVFIDIDGNRLTGFRVYRGEMGAEYMIMVTGKNNTIYTSEVYHYETYIVEQNWTYWTYMGNVSAAIGSHEMECALPKTIL
ncbi:MAG: zinc ribbon domain-containing protein, partial [Thermoplasmata archaeon]